MVNTLGMEHLIRTLRGLVLGLSISVMNLAGVALTIVVIGGLGDWTPTQFVGAFGIFEIATAIAFMFCPNIWRLPVIEAETSDRTEIKLAWSVVFIPHWAAAAKAIPGVGMVAFAAQKEGIGAATFGILPLVLATAVFVVGVSVAFARWGVHRPDLDVIQVVVRRAARSDIELPGISVSASVVQIVLGAITLPVVKVASPSTLFRPEVGPSNSALGTLVCLSVGSVVISLWAWRGRLAFRAPREQQRKAEEAS